MPEEFNVHLFERATESGVVYGSKAVGEPPLMQAFSVREALRQAAGRVRPARLVGRPRLPLDPGGGVLGDRGGPVRRHRRDPVGERRQLRGRTRCSRGCEPWTGSAPSSSCAGTALPGVLVTVIKVRGHAPRDAGAKMVVGADHSWGSVGGGNLEEAAVRRARELIASGAAGARDAGVPAQRARPEPSTAGNAAAARSRCCSSRCRPGR